MAVRDRTDDGFSLVEVIAAALVLATAAAGVVGLCVTAVRQTNAARIQTSATLLALDKLEGLRERPGLNASPAGALENNLPGYVDYLDAYGRSAGPSAGQPPSSAVYIRRWSVQPLPDDPAESSILQVLVTPAAAPRAASASGRPARVPGDVLLVSVRAARGQ